MYSLNNAILSFATAIDPKRRTKVELLPLKAPFWLSFNLYFPTA